jgi:hypothetical protein
MCINKVWDEMKQALLKAIICPRSSGAHETHHSSFHNYVFLSGSRIVEV